MLTYEQQRFIDARLTFMDADAKGQANADIRFELSQARDVLGFGYQYIEAVALSEWEWLRLQEKLRTFHSSH